MWSSRSAHIEDLQSVAAIYLLWLALYLSFRHVLFRTLSADGANRSVSLVHAFCGVVLPVLATDLTRIRDNIGTPTTPTQLSAMRFSLAYFLYDTFCCLAVEIGEGRLDLANTFHHIMTVVGLAAGLFHRTSGHELLLCLLLMEVSSPCLHLRYILREVGHGGSQLADINDILFASTFLLCRNVVGAPLVYWTVVSKRSPLLVKAGALGILLVSWFWTSKLVSMIARKAKRRPGFKAR